MGKTHYIIPVFIPHRGCPFDCIFCNQKKITGLDKDLTAEMIEEQINRYIKTIPQVNNKHVEIAFYGGSFTGIEVSKQSELLSVAYNWKCKGNVKDIRVSTRPDYINIPTMELLKRYGVSIVELGVQSMSPDVLEKSGRGHTDIDVIKAAEMIKSYGVKLGLQMMLGLPGDTFDKDIMTAEALIDMKPDFVRIYPTLVIKGTVLEKKYLCGQYSPLSLNGAIAIAKEVYLRFKKNNIPVIRIGLQPTEELMTGRDVVAGPFHPSFRYLVESEVAKDFLESALAKNGVENTEEIIIKAHNRFISNIVGHKKSNIQYLLNRFKLGKIKTITDDSLPDKTINITYCKQQLTYDLFQYIHNAI